MEFPVATDPAKPRDHCRLLVLHRQKETIEHLRFFDIVRFFDTGDCLAINASRVFPARIPIEADGKRGSILLASPMASSQAVLAKIEGRLAKKIKACGGAVCFKGGIKGNIEFLDFDSFCGAYVIRFDASVPLGELGETPLPPYIIRARKAAGKPELSQEDANFYQSVYAEIPGSMAAPTAGLHWSPKLLQELEIKGVSIGKLILHIGFASLMRADGQKELPQEAYDIAYETAQKVNTSKRKGKKVVACGTSVVRTLESVIDSEGSVIAQSGKTNLFIKPGFAFQAVDALITNFHLPDSTNFMLTQSFVGSRHDLASIYKTAAGLGYRFYSYGDAMLIL